MGKFHESKEQIVANEVSTSHTDGNGHTGLGIRHLQVFLLFFNLTVAYSFRTSLSIAVEAILDNSQNKNFKPHEWPSPIPDVVKTSFFVGYVIMQVPASQIIIKFGVKYPLCIAFLVCSLVSLLVPLAVSIHWTAVVACRILQGLSQGFCYPSCNQMISKWTPPAERTRASTFIFAGAQFGTVLAMPIAGWLSASANFGWPSVFYVNGAFGLVWVVLWFFCGSSSPSECKMISQSEEKLIDDSLSNCLSQQKLPIPWKAIFTSLPFWAIIITHCGHNWGFWTLLTDIPSYMKNVLGMDIAADGINSAIPYFSMWIFSFFVSITCDYLINSHILSRTSARKVFQGIGHYLPAIALIALGYVEKDQATLAMVLLVIAVTLNACVYCGYNVNHADIAPNFAGTLMAITNGASNVISIIAPIICGLIANDQTKSDPAAWRIVFFISAGIFMAVTTFFILFAQGEIQPWNEPKQSTNAQEDAQPHNESKQTTTPEIC